MLFNSLTFLLFFALVLGIHHLPLPWRVKKLNLLVASYLFYAAWNPPFVVLIWISTVVDWLAARRIASATGLAQRRFWLMVSLSANLGLLGFFKYGGFLLENFVAVVQALGMDYQPPAPGIILPIGISFYTFQTLSYTLDVYRGQLRPWRSFLDFALFVTFFPQLVAGPIVRAADFLPQCLTPRRADGRQFSWGLSLLVLGLFEKVVLADAFFAPIADKVYTQPGLGGSLDAWMGTLAFSGQIFCDFAGYSTCAIGVALCLGFLLPDNFRYPYAAIGFSDFWRRWHISLSTWLRDYLYIPLGGNRNGPARTQVNLMLTMLLGGLWHGAAWTFVFWGLLHGLLLVAERLLRRHFPPMAHFQRLPGQITLLLGTYFCVCITWVFFRAKGFADAGSVLTRMLWPVRPQEGALVTSLEVLMVGGLTLAMLSSHFLLRNTTLEEVAHRVPWPLRAVALAGLLVAIVSMGGGGQAFIYFQF